MMSATQYQLHEHAFTRGLAAQSAGGANGPIAPATSVASDHGSDDFSQALVAATLAIANVSRALHREPLARRLEDLSSPVVIECQVAAVTAALSLDPVAMKESTDETGDELFDQLTATLDGEHEDAAMLTDVERRREVCRAWVRSLLTTFRQALGGQLAVLRCGSSESAR